MRKKRVLIMGAAGRDFHNFNVCYRNNKDYEVVAFTAAQIPDIDDKVYPPSLSGTLYPNGISIRPETELEEIIKKENVEIVLFSYSDVPHEYVMHKASTVIAAGADFMLSGVQKTMLKSCKPVISICAVRTGCGKSQTTRRVINILKSMGKRVVAIRHPMPYGNLEAQAVQRFSSIDDMKNHKCTIEEMEEYEPVVAMGGVIYAGIDYEAILRKAEKEADVIVWDGGNNDTPFYKPDLHIVVTDPLRVGHELRYHPGEANLRLADVVVINKIDVADNEDIIKLRLNIRNENVTAVIVEAASPLTVDHRDSVRGKRVLVIEDGPTLTHGEMKFGAGTIAAEKLGASKIIDPRPFAKGKIIETYKKYPDIGILLPAMGYGDEQIKDLEKTINAVDCDLVIIATPVDLKRIIKINKPAVRVKYELQEIGSPTLKDVIENIKF